MADENVNLNLTVNDQASAALKGVADAIDKAAASERGLADAGRTADRAGRSNDKAAAPPRDMRPNPDLDAAFGVAAAKSAPKPPPPPKPAADPFDPKPPPGKAAGPAPDPNAVPDVAARGAEALAKLSDAIGRVADAEKKMSQEAAKLTQQQVTLQKQKDAFAQRQKEEAALAKKTPTVGDRVKQTAQGIQQVAGGGAAGGLGLIGKAGPWGAAAAAAVLAFEQGLQRGTAAVNILNSGALTAGQKMEGLKEEFIPFYGSIKKFREALDGTTETIARNDRERARARVRVEAEGTEQSKRREFEAPLAQAYETKRAFDAFGDIHPLAQHDRGTAVGARRSADQDVVYEKQDTARRADTAARGAKGYHEIQLGQERHQEGEARKAEDKAKEKAARLRELRAAEDKDPTRRAELKPQIDTAAKEAEVANAEAARQNAQWQAEINRAKESGLKYTEAEHAARVANIEAAKADLEVLKQREERMANFAKSLGSMNQADYEMAKEALKQIKDSGIESVPAEFADMAAKVAPEFIGKQREALGAKRAGELGGEFKGIDDSVINDFSKQTLAEVRAQVDKVKADVRVTIQLDAKQTADDIMNVLSGLLEKFRASVRVEANEKLRGQEIGASQGQNLQH